MHRAAHLAFPDAAGEPQCRLVLERDGGPGPTAAWLMCNPSRASHLVDDPTAGRVVAHSARWGFPRSLVGNVWAWRTPYPVDLWPALASGAYGDAMNAANLEALAMIGGQAEVHVAAFGAEPGRRFPRAVMAAVDAFTLGGRHSLYCIGTTDDGLPLHPLARGKLAIPRDVQLRPWERGERMRLAFEACRLTS